MVDDDNYYYYDMHHSVDFVGKVADDIRDQVDDNSCLAYCLALSFLPIDYYNSFRSYYAPGRYRYYCY